MNTYFLKVDPINECVGGFGQSRMISKWEGGEIALKSKETRYAVKKSKEPARPIQKGDTLWIWTHEDKGGQGLVARAIADSDWTQNIKLSRVALVSSPFGFDKFKKRPDNGYDTGTRLLDYKSISRGSGAYIIESDDLEEFNRIVERFGGGFLADQAIHQTAGNGPLSGFSWDDEIKRQKDGINSELEDRRQNWQKMRPVQGKFRDDLFDLYAGKCVLTGCHVPEAMEAAHVLPHNGDPVRDRTDNGLLLRRDLHTMFDAMLWSIDPETQKVRLARRLEDKSYSAFEGKAVDHSAAPEALSVHFRQFRKVDRDG